MAPVRIAWIAFALLGMGSATPPVAARGGAQVIVWRVTTLDARGHMSRVFHPGDVVRLRIQWSVRHAAPHARQTTVWTVSYGRTQVLSVAKTAPARDGNWSRITTATVSRTPDRGTYVFQGHVSVEGATADQSVTFSVR